MKKMNTRDMVLAAILTALVVILQFLGAFIKIGTFSISAVLIPIVIGAATCGIGIGAWLGFVFGVVVLLSGDAALFLAVDVPGTITTVLLKGTMCGLMAGVAYKYVLSLMDKLSRNRIKRLCDKGALCKECEAPMLKYFSRNNKFIATMTAAIVCPIVNTGIFLLGCVVFFLPTVAEWAGGQNVAQFMIVGFVGLNFLIEMGVNIVLSPVIVRLLNIRKK